MNDQDERPDKKIPQSATKKETGKRYYFDVKASKEAKQLNSGKSAEELEKEALANEADRNEKFRNHFERLAIASLYLIWVAIVLVGVTWIYHLLAPDCWPRLPDNQIDRIQAVLTGGVIAGIASGHMKRRLGD